VELLFVFGRLVFSVSSNVYQKKLTQAGLPPFYIVFTIYVVLCLLSLPLIVTVQTSSLGHSFWINISLASLFDVSGWMFLVLSLSKTDLSVFGPLNAYKDVFTLLLAVIFLHELHNTQGLIGVLIIIVGSFLLTPSNQQTQLRKIPELLKDKGVQARFLFIALFSVGTIF
jgi:drug/metabolite transporter (DMT)-like permease